MNQNNIQGVRQVTPEEIAQVEGVPLTKEELQKTQVLNLKEFKEAVHFEKITSKKPAIILAVLGALFIILGSGFQVVKSMNATKEPTIEPRNAPVQEPEEVVSTKKQLSCNMITKGKEDGTDVDYTLLFEFDNEKLIGFTKSYSVVATPGAENGMASIQAQIASFQPYLTNMTGFEARVDQTENGYVAYSNADYLTMDFTQYQDMYRSNFLTKIDFALDTSYQEVYDGMIMRQFDCK